MKYKHSLLGAIFALSSFTLIQESQAGTVYIKAEPIVVGSLPDVRGINAINALPLVTKIEAREVQRSVTDLSLAELGMVSTGGVDPEKNSEGLMVSSPVVASYNVPSTSGSMPNSIIQARLDHNTNPAGSLLKNRTTTTEVNHQLQEVLHNHFPELLFDEGSYNEYRDSGSQYMLMMQVRSAPAVTPPTIQTVNIAARKVNLDVVASSVILPPPPPPN
jgi:hypothetical protein